MLHGVEQQDKVGIRGCCVASGRVGVALSRLCLDDRTRRYVAQRTTEGLSRSPFRPTVRHCPRERRLADRLTPCVVARFPGP